MNVIHCPHCGTTNRVGSNFCNRCGANLHSDERPDDRTGNRGAEATSSPSPVAPLPASTARQSDSGERPTAEANEAGERAEFPADKEQGANAPADHAPPQQPSSVSPPATTTHLLVAGIEGLLDPVQIANEGSDQLETLAPPVAAEPFAMSTEQVRRIRSLLTNDPVLLDMPGTAHVHSPNRLHLPWLMLLLMLAVALPILLDFFGPIGAPVQWPGVAEAHTLIDTLPVDTTVLVIWAYDAATAGEMDLLALPLVSHLLARSIQPIVVSQLPGGPAMAQRLFDRATAGLLADDRVQLPADRALAIQAGYLPGGAALLSWVAQEPAVALTRHVPASATDFPLTEVALARPVLTIVVAAQAEGVQQWLEQGQPVQYAPTDVPTLAFTSAGADPILRPYLASGQLSGLVSGFDGAITYQQLRTIKLAVGEEALLNRHLILQNWGHFAVLLLLVLGNLAAWGRGGARG